MGLKVLIDFSQFSKYLRSVIVSRRHLALLPLSFLLIWAVFGSFIPTELCIDTEPCCCMATADSCCDPVSNESDGCCLQIDSYFCLPACTPAGFFEMNFQLGDVLLAIGKVEWPTVQSRKLFRIGIWRPPAATFFEGKGVLRI